MPCGQLWKPPSGVGTGNCVTTPEGVIRPIVAGYTVVNHMFPSGPAVIFQGRPVTGYSSSNTGGLEGLILPMLSPYSSVNQMFPSAPKAMPWGPLCAVGVPNSAMVTAASTGGAARTKVIVTTASKVPVRPMNRRITGSPLAQRDAGIPRLWRLRPASSRHAPLVIGHHRAQVRARDKRGNRPYLSSG